MPELSTALVKALAPPGARGAWTWWRRRLTTSRSSATRGLHTRLWCECAVEVRGVRGGVERRDIQPHLERTLQRVPRVQSWLAECNRHRLRVQIRSTIHGQEGQRSVLGGVVDAESLHRRRRQGGAVQVESSWTLHSLKAPGFNPCTLKCEYRSFKMCFQIQLVPLRHGGGVRGPRHRSAHQHLFRRRGLTPASRPLISACSTRAVSPPPFRHSSQ
jgi:hypothetical protein